MPMSRPGKIIPASSINDIPEAPEKEFMVDFHATFPISLKTKLLESAKKKGVGPNQIVNMAVEVFLK